jgi:hypothetical protein
MKIYPIGSIQDGCFVQPASVALRETIKDMTVVRVTDCSVLVTGMRRDSTADTWKAFRDYVANSMEVVFMSQKAEAAVIKIDSNESEGPKKRGRKKDRRVEIKFPDRFTIPELAVLNSVSKATAYIETQAQIKLNLIEIKDKVVGGRGKPKIVYGKKTA